MTPQSKVTMSNDASKKSKSLKDLKKAQKDKQAAKRASAAANFKVKKATTVIDTPKEASVSIIHVEVPEASGATQVDEDISVQTTTAVQDTADDALSSESFNLQAHRKALEAALYNNMETPKQMLTRVNFVVSVDAEYHQYGNYDELFGDENEVALQCRDDNRFVITPIASNPTTGGAAEPIKSQQEDTSMARSLTMDEMFAKVKNEGVSAVGSSGSKATRTLESVELEQTKRFFTIDQLFNLASQSGKTILRAVNMNNPSSARSVKSVEREMFTSHHEPQAEPFASYVDSAIISSHVKKNADIINNQEPVFTVEHFIPAEQYAHSEASEKLKSFIGIGSAHDPSSSTTSQPSSRPSSRHGTGPSTPLTRYSFSPPPAASQGPPAFFGEYYPMWANTFAEPPYTCAPPLPNFSYGDQPFYAGPVVHPWPIYHPHADRWHPTAWA